MEDRARFKIIQAFFLGAALWAAGCLVLGTTLKASSGPDVRAKTPGLVDAYLYFAAPDNIHLKAVPKQFPVGMDAHRFGKALLDALMAGPQVSGVGRTFPVTTRVNALFITDNNDAYVDLGMEAGEPPGSDTITEYIQVYSLVNTLTVNNPQIDRVKILVNGSEAASFGGHISLDAFFKTNMLIVK